MAASNSPTTITSEKVVTTAGTAVPLVAASQRVRALVLIAKSGNLGRVYWGGADIADTTNDGMDAGDVMPVTPENWLDLADIFIDSDSDGEGYDFYAVKA